MVYSFSVHDNGDLPSVYINNVKMEIVYLTYAWHTRTDSFCGANICVVDGYLKGDYMLQRFVFDLSAGTCTEIPMEEVKNE